MTRTLSAVLSATAITAALTFGSAAAFAQTKTAKVCEEEWTTKKADIQKAGKKKKDFIAECRAMPATAATNAAPTTAPANSKPATTTATTPPTNSKPATTAATTTAKPTTEGKPGREAMIARERACGADWKAEKAAGKIPTGQTWPKYWSECNTRKKSAGM